MKHVYNEIKIQLLLNLWNYFLLGTTKNKPIKFPDAIFENDNELQEGDVNQVDIKRETDDYQSYQNLTWYEGQCQTFHANYRKQLTR